MPPVSKPPNCGRSESPENRQTPPLVNLKGRAIAERWLFSRDGVGVIVRVAEFELRRPETDHGICDPPLVT